MRNLKLFIAGLLLVIPVLATAGASDIPDGTTWYLHVDLENMRSEEAGKAVYDWFRDEALNEIKEESGFNIERELDRLTAYSLVGEGPVFLFEGNFSQESKDRVMTLIAAAGDLKPNKSSGKSYYRLAGNDTEGESDNNADENNASDNIEIQIEALANESWVSLDLKNKIILSSSEEQMQRMLKSGGKITGSRNHDGALIVLRAEKALLQAGMDSSALGDDDGDSGWDSNILRNTEQVALLIAAAADKLTIEIRLVTAEPEMAQSLASVTRGLISLVSFDDELDDDAAAVLRGTKVEAKGNSLSISLAISPSLVVSALSD